MRVRKAGKGDLGPVLELARRLDLFYEGIGSDRTWLAEEDGKVIGLAVLKRHPDCLELCALGVEPSNRRRGIAALIIDEVLRDVDEDLYLATVIPAYFKKRGFSVSDRTPRAFIEKRASSWCDGCRREKCVIMVKRT